MNTLEITSPTMPTRSVSQKNKTLTISYWVLTLLVAIAMLADGVAGLMLEQTGQEVMRQLGYPVYIMTITGVAKLLGAVALVQTRFVTIKEWAYAGFTINFIGAGASWLLAGKDLSFVIAPLVALALLFGTYFLWKQVNR